MTEKEKRQQEISDMGRSIAEAYMWVGRIMSICGVMLLPALGGMWLDNKLGTTPGFTLGGFAFGMTGALVMLLRLNKINTVESVAKEIVERLEDADLPDQPTKPK